jgi:uncharacterized protein
VAFDVAFALVPFLGGLTGSLHCVGMCGGFPLAVRHHGPGLRRQLVYNLGRLNTLVFLGAIAGGAGAAVVAGAGPLARMERVLAMIAGVVIIVAGCDMLGVLSWRAPRLAVAVQRTLGRLLGGAMRSSSALAPLAIGMFNALLPCQLVYAFVAQAATTGTIAGGMVVMLAFGLGTMPTMLALGMTRVLARPSVRALFVRGAGILVIGFGLLTLLRGVTALHGHHH